MIGMSQGGVELFGADQSNYYDTMITEIINLNCGTVTSILNFALSVANVVELDCTNLVETDFTLGVL